MNSTVGNEREYMSCRCVDTKEVQSWESAYEYLIEDTIANLPDEGCFSADAGGLNLQQLRTDGQHSIKVRCRRDISSL